MQESYWRYVCVWGEPGEWDEWKERIANDTRDVDGDSPFLAPIGVTPTEDDEKTIQKLCDYGYYNPLKDTRPYYYATYNEIRGTGKVYTDIQHGGGPYVIDYAKGDEFQNNSSATTSFMDILNSKVVFQTQKRIYRNCDYDSRNTEPADRATADHPQGIGLVKYYKELLDDGTSLSQIPGT